jgi:hypothetical protein
MSVFATIVIANKNQAAAQNLTSPDMFTSQFKKGLRKYWVSSGNFPQDYFNACEWANICDGNKSRCKTYCGNCCTGND